jgi:CO/xanthine dehydrogenase Mo-binding subunit
MGISMALHEDLLYDPASGPPPNIEVMFIQSDDGFGPYGAKSIGESGKVPSVGAVANAIYNALGHRMKDLPITRDGILGVLA